MTDADRPGYIAGLRQLADILEAHPDLPLPYGGTTTSELLWIANSRQDHKQVAATFARTIPGVVAKQPRGTDLDLIGRIAGLHVQLIVDRDAVCERVVVGSETVTVPARPATEATPEQTETREVVEWRCASILTETTPTRKAVA